MRIRTSAGHLLIGSCAGAQDPNLKGIGDPLWGWLGSLISRDELDRAA
jgi:hypothetical protein